MPFDNPYFPATFDVGTPGAGHIHFANNGSMTLFGPDGHTQLATLNPVNGFELFAGPNQLLGLLLSTSDPAELAAASIININSSADFITPNRQPLLTIQAGEGRIGEIPLINLWSLSYDGTIPSSMDIEASTIFLYSIAGGIKKLIAQFDNSNTGANVLHYDGSTLTANFINNPNGILTTGTNTITGGLGQLVINDRVTAVGNDPYITYVQNQLYRLFRTAGDLMRIDANGSIVLPLSGSSLRSFNSTFAGAAAANQWFTGTVSGDSVILQTGTLFVGDGTNFKPIKASAFTVSSTIRHKQGVRPLREALPIVNQLRPVEFAFIADPDVPRAGFIAEEVDRLFPQAVSYDGDGWPDGIHYGEIVPLLTDAIQAIDRRLVAAGI